MREAVAFIKAKTQDLTRLFTQEHHKIIKSYLDFKASTQAKVERVEYLEERLFQSEIAFAGLAYTVEATVSLDEKSPLSLYDCLIPHISYT